MKSHENQRVGVFVDVQNMYHSAKNLHSGNVNFENVLKTAVDDRLLVHAFAYVAASQSGEEGGFVEALNKQGFYVKMKDLQVFSGGAKKADRDVEMAVDTIKFCDKLDIVVLVTGDGDFVPLVQYLQEKGCVVEVMAFAESSSTRLQEVADRFTDLSTDTKRFILGKRRGMIPKVNMDRFNPVRPRTNDHTEVRNEHE